VINVFFWGLDLLVGANGLQWAFRITLFWGLALAFHAVAYFVAGRQVAERKTQQYLADQRRQGASGRASGS
jgi:hypothetical protein